MCKEAVLKKFPFEGSNFRVAITSPTQPIERDRRNHSLVVGNTSSRYIGQCANSV